MSAAIALGVPAVRELLTTDQASSVVHDTETMALVAHAGRLFAATDQWMYPGSHAAGLFEPIGRPKNLENSDSRFGAPVTR